MTRHPAPAAARPSAPDYDVIIAGDFSTDAAAGLRAVAETAALTGAGYRVGLLHVPDPDRGAAICPEMETAARLPGATILAPHDDGAVSLLVLHPGRSLGNLLKGCRLLDAGRTVAVITNPACLGDVTAKHGITAVPAAHWSPALPQVAGLKSEKTFWPMVAAATNGSPVRQADQKLRIGVLANPETRLAATDVQAEIVVFRTRGTDRPPFKAQKGWTVLDGAAVSLDWFLRKIDALAVTDTSSDSLAPVVAAALAAGKLVAAPPAVAQHLGRAVLPTEPANALAGLVALAGDSKAAAAQRKQALVFAQRSLSGEALVRRVDKLIGKPRRRRSVDAAVPVKKVPRVLFMPKGGVGIGHVARTIAVARRAAGRFEPVFVALAEQAGLIESFGYRAEYIPSAAYANLKPADWEPWLQRELEAMIADYSADALVFDGSDPTDAMIAAAASRSGCKLAWIRRGMWETGYNPSLHQSPAFDLILEPGELAASRDAGATAKRRHEAHQLAPIMLLDRHELLPREKAAAALGLDPSRPAVLLQLGSGENRDVIGLIDTVIAQLSLHPDLQIAVAEWANAPGSLKLWKGVKVIKGAPLSLYFNAFDFSIAAAGYNTFHEAIAFGLPSIFIPNTAPGMDDQRARAQFAQDSGAAIELPDSDLGELPQLLGLMTNENFRSVMRKNCEGLFAGNGAAEAGTMISALVN